VLCHIYFSYVFPDHSKRLIPGSAERVYAMKVD
jgi:hypothetical protein